MIVLKHNDKAKARLAPEKKKRKKTIISMSFLGLIWECGDVSKGWGEKGMSQFPN